MGNQNAHLVGKAALAGRLDGLTDQAHLVLYAMAMVAHDDDRRTATPQLYWRGWPYLAEVALCRHTYDDAAERAVARCIRQLVKEGLVEPMGKRGGSRGPMQYRLHLGLP